MRTSVPRVLAHRGASAEAPENTMPAFELAWKLGAGGIECDVRLTEDDVPVIIHDATVGRTTDGRGRVRRHTLEEIRALDAGAGRGPRFRGTRIPTLEEVLDAYGGRVWLDLELKPAGKDPDPLVSAMGEAVQDRGLEEATLVSSFLPDLLDAARERYPRIPRALIAAAVPDPAALDEFADGLDAVGVSKDGARPEVLERARDLDLAFFVWTVDRIPEARRFYEMGVDGLITKDPRRILRVSPP